jgi:CDGSH-type Zn-finger protein
MYAVTITPTDNGPNVVHGRVTVRDEDGNEFEVDGTIALCRCGHSSSKPFCDGTHERANFAAVNRAAASPSLNPRRREDQRHRS